MDDLIGRVVASIGVDRPAAEKAVGIILQCQAGEDAVGEIVGAIPGLGQLV